ncbi:unnamed protein product [Cylicostephanus goldi]|uniref:Transthyretin/hydroxyisourate hydrolase domain-containing protein n=1 Tax=Cylicostephanus goldi TaxID=71465 RepID=A0A3P7MJV0_CYLGO|nr:unnamed protein product [Cylicostephanus goldi]
MLMLNSADPGDRDDLLDEKYTDKDGEFALTGTTRELTDIEPVLYIYHDCDDGIRKWENLPDRRKQPTFLSLM